MSTSKMTVQDLSKTGLEKLSADSLLPFVEWWDFLYLEHRDTHESLFQEGIARMTLAMGDVVSFKPGTPIERTLSAASQYLKESDQVNWSRFANAATQSYPFGPGDGCLGIEELGHDSCGPGSGCRSGIGFLYFVSRDRARTQECLRAAWREWG